MRILDRKSFTFYWILAEGNPVASKMKMAETGFGVPHRFIIELEKAAVCSRDAGHRILATIKNRKGFYNLLSGSLN